MADIPSFPSGLNPNNISSLVPSAPCGTDFGLSNLKGSIKSLLATLDGFAASINGLADSISGLGAQLTSSLNDMLSKLKSAISLPSLPSFKLPDMISQLLSAFSSGNFLGLNSLIRQISSLFPSFDLSGIFRKLLLGRFNLCRDVPNLNIIDGQVVENAIAPIAAHIDAIRLPNPPTIPTALIPEIEDRLSAASIAARRRLTDISTTV